MFTRIFFKLFTTLFPQGVILTGSLLMCFSLKLVSTESLWEQEGVVNGGLETGGMMSSLPVQNDPLFWWGFILFIIGTAMELIRISHHTIQEEMKAIEAEKSSSLKTD